MEFKNENPGSKPVGSGFPPKNWLVESILVTLFCCLPLGIVGIINAAGVEGKFAQGDIEGANRAAQTAKTMVLISALVGVLGVFLYIVLFGGLAFLGAVSE